MVTCEFCNRELSTLTNLYIHQRNTRYCLEKQEEMKQKAIAKKEKTLAKKEISKKEKHKCEYCNSVFNSISSFNKHDKICIDKIILNTKKEITEKYEKIIENYDKRIDDYEKRIQEYIKLVASKDETIERVMNTLASKKTTTINNNSVYYNNINFEKIPPVTKQFLLDKSKLLNHTYMDVEKMGGFIGKHLMENVYFSDISRHKFVFVDSNKKPVTDYTIENLLYIVLSPLEHKLATIADEALKTYAKDKPEYNEIKKLNATLQNIAKNCELTFNHNKIRGRIITSICKTAKGKQQLLEFVDENEKIKVNNDSNIVTDNKSIKINEESIVETENEKIKTNDELNTKTTTEYVKKFNNKELEYVDIRLEKGVWIDKHNNRYDESCFDSDPEPESDSDEKVIVIKPVQKELSIAELNRLYPPKIDIEIEKEINDSDRDSDNDIEKNVKKRNIRRKR